MEDFKNIDWTPNLEDIVDNQFLDEKKLQREGAMYRIVNGTFEDPFQDIRPYRPKPNKEENQKKTRAANNKKPIAKKKKGRPVKKKKTNNNNN